MIQSVSFYVPKISEESFKPKRAGMVNKSISDSVKSFVSECPIHHEEDNVLFCFYLSTQEWEKVNEE